MLQRIQSTSSRKNGNSSEMEYLDACDIEDEGFIEGDVVTEKVLSAFNFEMSSASNDDKALSSQVPVQEKTNELFNIQNQSFASAPRGLTPPIDGAYAMRPSTIRKPSSTRPPSVKHECSIRI